MKRIIAFFILMVMSIFSTTTLFAQDNRWHPVADNPFNEVPNIKIASPIVQGQDYTLFGLCVVTTPNIEGVFLDVYTTSHTFRTIMDYEWLVKTIVAFKINNKWSLDTLYISNINCRFESGDMDGIYLSQHSFYTPYSDVFLNHLKSASEIHIRSVWYDDTYFDYPTFSASGSATSVNWLINEKNRLKEPQ